MAFFQLKHADMRPADDCREPPIGQAFLDIALKTPFQLPRTWKAEVMLHVLQRVSTLSSFYLRVELCISAAATDSCHCV